MEEKSKLKHVLQFLKQTINDKIVMVEENLSQLCTWVDDAYGVHPYLKSHTDGSALKSQQTKIEYKKFH